MDKWNGQFIKKKRYEHQLKRQKTGRNNKGRRVIKETNATEPVKNENIIPVEGSRLIDMQHIAKQMCCLSCDEPLLLQHIVKEKIAALGTTFDIKCTKCASVRPVTSSPRYKHPDPEVSKQELFSVNSKIALGALHTGNGHTQINRILQILGLPGITDHTFKAHERIVGNAVEKVAAESCESVIRIEKQLTLDNLEEIQSMLPPDYQDGFMLVEKADVNGQIYKIVRIVASFDMGWSQRSNGYTYDSLNGYCCLIGLKTGKVLAYGCYNRKCKQCDVDQKTGNKTNHDCRLNCYGTAKSMEAQGAVHVVTNQKLKDNNVQVGVLIADNDSSSIAAVQNAVRDYKVLKQSDMNHSTKGVSNKLHEIAKSKTHNPDDEMSHDFINYLKKCFTSAVKQNRGDLEKMQKAIKNIPNHVFNNHENCGAWCRSGKENYERSYDVNSPILLKKLNQFFTDLQESASNFVMAGSSQANESLNNSMCSKNPKRICYSTTASSDHRFACTVSQKNLGENYVLKVFDKLDIGWNKELEESIQKRFDKSLKKYQRSIEPRYKRKRVEKRNERTQLRNRKEAMEGTTYESNMSLLECNGKSSDMSLIKDNEKITPFSTTEIEIVFFDLETGGFHLTNNEILQICMISEEYELNVYITPTKAINPRASQIHGLTKIHTKLYKNGVEINTISLRKALQQVILYLQKVGKKCLLVAHNCSFDSNRLVSAINKHFLDNEFKEVVHGFADSLPLFKHKFPKLANHKLTTLAKEILDVDENTIVNSAHNALFDVQILKRLVIENLEIESLVKKTQTYNEVQHNMENRQRVKDNVHYLKPFEGVISINMIQRLSEFNIKYEMLLETLKNEGVDKTRSVLRGELINGKPTIIKRNKIIDDIIQNLKKASTSNDNN